MKDGSISIYIRFHCDYILTQIDRMTRTGTIVNMSADHQSSKAEVNYLCTNLWMLLLTALSLRTYFEKFRQISPKPTGAPGRLDLMDEKANKAPRGTTNISEYISGFGYTIVAALIVTNTMAVSPG